MNKHDAINLLKAREADLRASGLAALYLFGSTARGDERPDSDIDLACEIDASRRIGLFDFAQIQLDIEEVLHNSVDLVELGAMHQRVFKHANADMVRVF
jgi:predicted nucleotidyltransferase